MAGISRTVRSFGLCLLGALAFGTGCRKSVSKVNTDKIVIGDTPNQVAPETMGKPTARQRLGLHTTKTLLEFRPQPKPIVSGETSLWQLKVMDVATMHGDPKEHKGVGQVVSPDAILKMFTPTNNLSELALRLARGRLMHLFLVPKDLSDMKHLLPQYNDYGNFVTDTTIDKPGDYKIYAEYMPLNGDEEVAQKEFKVAGQAPSPVKPIPLVETPTSRGLFTALADSPDDSAPNARKTANLDVELQISDYTGKTVTVVPPGVSVGMRFSIRDHGGSNATLEPYLALPGMVTLISDDSQIFLAATPRHWKPTDAVTSPVTFDVRCPSAGLYKMWAEFQVNGVEIRAPFVIRAGIVARQH